MPVKVFQMLSYHCRVVTSQLIDLYDALGVGDNCHTVCYLATSQVVMLTSQLHVISLDLFHTALCPFCLKRLKFLLDFRLMIKFLVIILV